MNSLSFSTSFLVFYVNIFNNRLINIRILFFLNIKKVTCCEKKYLPPSCFFLFVCFAYLLHISGHNLILILDRKNPSKYKRQFLNKGFHLLRGRDKLSNPPWPFVEKVVIPNPNNGLCQPWQQGLQLSICDNWR